MMNERKKPYDKYTEFDKTRQLFEQATPDLQYPLTYGEWIKIPDQLKPSALFVTFYNAIISITVKMENIRLSDQDKISSIMHRFMRISKYIEANPKTYKPSIIGEFVSIVMFFSYSLCFTLRA